MSERTFAVGVPPRTDYLSAPAFLFSAGSVLTGPGAAEIAAIWRVRFLVVVLLTEEVPVNADLTARLFRLAPFPVDKLLRPR